MGKKSENKNNSNVATKEKLNRLKDSIKGTLTRLETFTSEKTVSKDTSVTEIEIKLKKIEQLQINLDKIAEDYCEIETSESLEIIQLDIEDINQRIETTEVGLKLLMYSLKNTEKGNINLNENGTYGEIKNEALDKINYYIPHHSVYKQEKASTPLRVVFDASAKTTSGFSLNSILLHGGIIQQDLFSIVSRFRKHEYAFSADIKKMYRQILVDPNQRDLQRIMWKTSADAPVKTYKLATVTYGTVSGPFLATRT
ncbi:integrase catalytic domain-containing protein [Trichonephila clavipes]|nr:integrase catalytic domain-containing protein [Trichonephila clavipes]